MRAILIVLVASMVFLVLAVGDVAAQAGYITTIVGNGTLVNCDADPPPVCISSSGDGGPALAAGFGYPRGIALDSAENLYIVDYYGHRGRRVDAATGIITTFAGNGISGTGGDGGPATSAQLWYPVDVAFDASDNLYISMLTGDRVRKVDAATGLISCVAGCAYSLADGIPATSSALADPGALAVDTAGNLYIANGHVNFSSVRKVDAATGLITTVAGTGVPGYNGDGIPATSAELRIPAGIAIDAVGNVYIADQFNHRIRRVDALTGIITTIAGTGDGSEPLADEGLSASLARIYYPGYLEFDAGGSLFFSTGQTVRRIDAQSGILTTVAGDGAWGFYGDGGPATAASFRYTHGTVFDSAGNLLISDSGNQRIRRVESAGPPANGPSPATGKMTGGGRVDTGQTTQQGKAKPQAVHTTHGFELYFNPDGTFGGNLQYNDHRKGDAFHVTGFTYMVFIDDPVLSPGNPTARFDTAIVEGVGRLNGVNGVQFRAVITDNGEPGRTGTFKITFPGGQSVGISGPLVVGNHQAHGS